jgi:hypothetical protein
VIVLETTLGVPSVEEKVILLETTLGVPSVEE